MGDVWDDRDNRDYRKDRDDEDAGGEQDDRGNGDWPPMIWIGGAPGAGKSTLARALARREDLPLHPVDLWAYDHAVQLPPIGSLDDELARGPRGAAIAFEATRRARLGLVVGDIRARSLGDVPAVVEGPQLAPVLARRLPEGHSVWLVPDPVRTRSAREQRLAAIEVSAAVAAERDRLEALLARDAVLAGSIRQEASRAGLPVVEVPANPDWAVVAAALESAIEPALERSSRLAPGPQLARQRRWENEVACRQGRQWQRVVGLAAAPLFPFGCECGRSGCDANWFGTPDEFEAVAARGWLVAEIHAR